MAGGAFVRVERRGRCAWVRLDRPPLNLIVPEMIEGLRSVFGELRTGEDFSLPYEGCYG